MGIPAIAAAGVANAYSAIPEEKKAQLKDWLKRSLGKTVDSVGAITGIAKKSEANAAIVAEGLVRAGAPVEVVSTIFSGSPNADKIRASLVSLGRQILATEDAARPGLNGTTGDAAGDVLRISLVRSLVRLCGSVAEAQKVQMALATLRQEDFDWYKAVQPALGR